MPDKFTQLRQLLESVDRWLEVYSKTDQTQKQQELARSLRKYVDHCYRDDKKWRSESKAEDAITKINSVWIKLYKPALRKD